MLETGRFARGCGNEGETLGLILEVLPSNWRAAIHPAAVKARLRAEPTHAIKAVMVVQIDIASGVVDDVQAIRAATEAAGPPALFMIDSKRRSAACRSRWTARALI